LIRAAGRIAQQNLNLLKSLDILEVCRDYRSGKLNYLAHLFLAGEKEEAKLGGILGDFEKGSVIGKYNRETEIEIHLHRKIDFFTDNHPIVKEAKKLLTEEKRRYGNILLDVFYDHILAQKWKHYAGMSLNDFTERVYSILLRNTDILPTKLGDIVPLMVQQDWLGSYQEFSGFEKAIVRISKRLRQGNTLVECISDIKTNYSDLVLSFGAFFPNLIDYVEKERATSLINLQSTKTSRREPLRKLRLN
jgi:acyl carrier protein phosphodiesterase